MGRWELVPGGTATFWKVAEAAAGTTVRFGRLDLVTASELLPELNPLHA